MLNLNEHDFNMLLALHKEMKEKEPSQTELEKILVQAKKHFPIGATVDVNCTSHFGEVVGYNERTGGFYPGTRFPVYVKITLSDMERAIGQTFEYGLDQLKMC